MLAVSVRSGLVETYHGGAVAVVDADGTLAASSGDIDRPFYLRSAAKPFQAHISQKAGADLAPLELAIAAASHRGFPAHISLVEEVLARGGLSPEQLMCPPDWPIASRSSRALVAAGQCTPRPLWHNCSGKHAGFLRACVAAGWPTDSYLDPRHPLQQSIVEFVTELGEFPAGPVGTDGCGAPVLRTTVRAMALLFARLGELPELHPVFEAMHRYPAVVASNGESDAGIATALYAAAKGGAQGCLGVALADGVGIAVKSWDGLGNIAGVAAIAALESMSRLTPTAAAYLEPLQRPSVKGGGRVVGHFESRLELTPRS